MEETQGIRYAEPSTPAIEDAPIDPPGRYQWAWAPAVFAFLTLAMFIDVLFTPNRVVSSESTDLAMQFIPWREFGFSELSKGNLPLWNPFIYSGTPYFAGFQAALIYPPNWLHLIFPVGLAINWIVALHVFLAGYFTYLWCRARDVGFGGSILAGVIFMFSGPYFLHLYAGHLPHLAVMVWTPLMLLTIDKLIDTGQLKWCLLGVVAAAMHILAGHPQYVYFTGLALGLYLLIRAYHSTYRVRAIAGFTLMYAGAVLLSAMQLLPGIQATGEQVRSAGLSYQTASTFAVPPENFATLFAPTFLGQMRSHGVTAATGGYWGAGYLWEVSIFVSITALVLALLAVTCRWRDRRVVAALILIGVMLIFALGRHTPVYGVMYRYLPMYSSFRGAAKFAYIAVFFVGMLAGIGFDTLLRQRRVPWLFLYTVGAFAFILAMGGAIVLMSAETGPSGAWGQFAKHVRERGLAATESYSSLQDSVDDRWVSPATMRNVRRAGRHAANMTFVGAGVVALIALLLWLCRFDRRVPYLLLLVATIELFTFARVTRATMNPAVAKTMDEPWHSAVMGLVEGERFLTSHNMLDRADFGMSLGRYNMSGYDPGVLRRYAQLIYAWQGMNPDKAEQYLPIFRIDHHGVLRMFRCALVLDAPANPPFPVPAPLPLAVVVPNWVTIPTRDNAFAYMFRPDFDPTKTVILEESPSIQPIADASRAGLAHLIAQTTDTMEFRVEMDRPGVLLITSNYSTGWRLHPINSGQASYRVMPANYTLIGVPLERGSHHFVLEYSPLAFRAGRWITILSLITFTALTYLVFRPLRRGKIG